MGGLSQKYGALFGLYDRPAQPKTPKARPRRFLDEATLGDIPEGPDKDALLGLWAMMAEHPVRVFGKRGPDGWKRCGLDVDPKWQAQNPEAWKRAHGLWCKSLWLIFGYCMDSLPWPGDGRGGE